MEKIYRNFIQCIRERDYESVGWILNNTDPKALYDLISKMNPTENVYGDSAIIIQSKLGIAALSWLIDSGYVMISVMFSENKKTNYKAMLGLLYPKFPRITLSIPIHEEKAFSIDICCLLEDCISTKFEKKMSDDEIAEYNGCEHQ